MECNACNGKHVKHTCGKNKKRKVSSNVIEVSLNNSPSQSPVTRDKATKASSYSNSNSPVTSPDSNTSPGTSSKNKDATTAVPIARLYNIGEKVHAIWHNGLLYEAEVIDYDKKDINRIIVKWTTSRNDYKNCNIHLDYVRKLIKLEKNMEVSAMYYGEGPGNGHMFKAKIETILDEFVIVIWADNTLKHRRIHKSDISPLSIPKSTHKYNVGEKVLARWYGQDNGYMYTAIIETVTDKVAKVKWDDGVLTHKHVGIKDMLPYHIIRDVN